MSKVRKTMMPDKNRLLSLQTLSRIAEITKGGIICYREHLPTQKSYPAPASQLGKKTPKDSCET